MSDGVGGTRALAVSLAFVLSGVTSFITLISAKRFLTSGDFGVFAIFWSLGFFAAALSASPVEQEFARSASVQLERGVSPRREISIATRTMAFGSIAVLMASGLALLTGLIGADVTIGVFVALVALVVGEAVGALVRGEAAARRDIRGLTVEVAGHGLVRAAGAVIAGAVTGNLVVVCLGVSVGGIVSSGLMPRLLRRQDLGMNNEVVSASTVQCPPEFSMSGLRRLTLGTPPRALFAIGTPVLAAVVARDGETAAVGDVLAALSITSAPVLVAAALQATLIPQFAAWGERGAYAEAHARLILIISSVIVGTVACTMLAAVAGRPALEAVFGEMPGVGRGALVSMTAGAGMLFLANMLTPASIASHRYTTMTLAWTIGAVGLVVAAFGPGGVAESIGRAVLIGATVVNVVLLWGLRSLLRPLDRPARALSSGPPGGSGA